jgi:starvation-inducible outer membrane lipoprotein
MKHILLFCTLALLVSCTSLPIDVFQIRDNTSIEEMRSLVSKRPDKITHTFRAGKALETWLWLKENISITFENGLILEWHN